MFYSETLLSKTGPLARVWLSANLERKLSKTHILQSNIESSVNAIVDQGTAPMALRLSGQLLLGVVRIYSRKARYLLDDCNEALLKIKMAFRPGNVDLPANMSMPSTAALTLEDRISDPILPELDASLLDFQPTNRSRSVKLDDPMNWNSQLPIDSSAIEIGRRESVREARIDFDDEAMDIDLDLDLGLDDGPSLELGRKAQAPDLDDTFDRGDGFLPEILEDKIRASSEVPSLVADINERNDEDEQPTFGFDDYLAPELPEHDAEQGHDFLGDARLQRTSQSPLSSRESSVDPDAENLNEVIARKAPQRAKKRKVLQEDADTTLSSAQIKEQQSDRSAILKPASYLSQDVLVYNILNSQKTGLFVPSIMGDKLGGQWAPELKDLICLDNVRKSGERKRKRDSGIADVGEDAIEDEQPILDIPDETLADFDGADFGFGVADEIIPGAHVHLPAEDNHDLSNWVDDADAQDKFEETTVPLIHPSEQGVVSQGTRHAVHLLREQLGGSAETARDSRAQLTFQTLQPESSTIKEDATKMFFEILVLATKDAIKVDQASKDIGEAIRIRAKRGLWGAWAEQDAGGEIEKQLAPISVL